MLLQRLIKRRQHAPRLAYVPWIAVTALFGASALIDERRDVTSLLGLLPLAIVMGQVVYPTVLGWAVIWVPAALGSLLLLLRPQDNLGSSVLIANVAFLVGPALSVMLFPPRIRQGGSQLRFIAAVVVAATFVLITLGMFLYNPANIRKPSGPVRRVESGPAPTRSAAPCYASAASLRVASTI